jgi:hypothetical protein
MMNRLDENLQILRTPESGTANPDGIGLFTLLLQGVCQGGSEAEGGFFHPIRPTDWKYYQL